MRRLAVIGHRRTIRPIIEVINRHYKEVEVIEVEFTDTDRVTATVEYVKALQETLDGIIFTGFKPYEIINSAMGIHLPQVYIHHDQSILLQTLMAAAIKEDYDIRSFSIDSYKTTDLVEVLEDLDLMETIRQYHVASSDIKSQSLVEDLYRFHKEAYDKGEAAFCMTGISMVYESLSEGKVPCLLMQLTKEAIHNGIKQLWNKINAIEDSESQIVVLSVEIDLPSEYHLIHDNEYQLMLEKSKVSEHIYKFAELIQAAVVETGSKNYILFSTRQILESVTDKLHYIPVLSSVNRHTAHTLSIGIGYGKTAREAKYNAALGLNRALTQGGNQAFSVQRGAYSEAILGKAMMKEDTAIVDSLYKTISEQAGISVNTIYRLHCIKEKLGKDRFTSGELADEFGNTRRSMNRLLEKLVKVGYASIDGTRMMSDSGRPTRIIKLDF